MTGLEFLAAGVVVEQLADGRFRVAGPKDRPELLSDLRFEIATRLELFIGELPKGKRAEYQCDLCGDQIGHARDGRCPLCETSQCRRQTGGWCMLCTLARHKSLRDKEQQR